jgi:hypothetical protein
MLSGPRRALLADALSNVADVTVQMVADDSSTVPAVLTELNYSIVNGTLDVSSSPPPSLPPPPAHAYLSHTCSKGAFLTHSCDCTHATGYGWHEIDWEGV